MLLLVLFNTLKKWENLKISSDTLPSDTLLFSETSGPINPRKESHTP